MEAAALLPHYLEACAWAESGDLDNALGEHAPEFAPEAEEIGRAHV